MYHLKTERKRVCYRILQSPSAQYQNWQISYWFHNHCITSGASRDGLCTPLVCIMLKSSFGSTVKIFFKKRLKISECRLMLNIKACRAGHTVLSVKVCGCFTFFFFFPGDLSYNKFPGSPPASKSTAAAQVVFLIGPRQRNLFHLRSTHQLMGCGC